MQGFSVRPAFIAGVAIAGAVIWGAAEFLALQWSRLGERVRAAGWYRTF